MKNRESLIEFVKQQHGDQLRKYTNEPYFNHLLNVANMAEKTGIKYGWEIGLCHDLFEDTKCEYRELELFFLEDYSYAEVDFILTHVQDLTDILHPKPISILTAKSVKNVRR